ncbi:YheU family protein [Saccharospirillum mangrovi]|uniref:YheU family protein n=1 Tax=Saccharospirillum mangrovi TaxID=2161747 RepID=UPI001300762E|nr:YheU family protein [Saccharospirillum mangrovi]
MIIPAQRLEADTLVQVIRECLMRQGEDWGLEEGSLDAAIERARQALSQGRLVLYWNAQEESLALVDPRTLSATERQAADAFEDGETDSERSFDNGPGNDPGGDSGQDSQVNDEWDSYE